MELSQLYPGMFLKGALIAGALGIGCAAFAGVGDASLDKRPNVLFISIDDLNDWVGCLQGHPQVKTPHIDRLAARGVLFRNAHCAVPVCSGSRASTYTGLTPLQTGVLSNGQKLSETRPDAVLLPDDLAARGYLTLGTGKLLHSAQRSREMVAQYGPGYDKWMPLLPEERRISEAELQDRSPYVRHAVPRLGLSFPLNEMPRDRFKGSAHVDSFDWGPIDLPEDQWTDTVSADWVVEKLGESYDKPFFIGLGFYRPHQPLWVPQAYYDLYPHASVTLPRTLVDDLADVSRTARDFGRLPLTSGSHETVVDYGQWPQAVSAYLACISFVDAQLGKVLDALDASGHADDTLIVLWSDHGWQLGEKEHWGKFTAWERSTRVPVIVVPPQGSELGRVAAARVVDQPVSLVDLYPTVLEFAGLEPTFPLGGRSLVPLIEDPEAAGSRAAVTWVGHGTCTVRVPGWRYTVYFDGSEELYDHSIDPEEWTNLASDAQYATQLVRLRQEVPVDRRYRYFVRCGDYKLLVPADGSPTQVYGPGPAMLSEKHDIAAQQADLVQHVEAFLSREKDLPQRLSVPIPQ